MSYLLDTDTCIYWFKGRLSVRDKLLEVGIDQVAICVITVAELYYGAYNSNRITENLARAEQFVQTIQVLLLTDAALKRFGELKAQLRQAGQILADFDLLIASIALTENCILVTNNIRHYNRVTGLNLENWI